MSKAKTARAPEAFEPDDSDIVADMLAAVRSIWPELSPEGLKRAEAQIRERWGGDRPYIGRRAGDSRSARNDAILRDHARGERVPYLCRRYSLCERQVLRILKAGGALGA